ncbi:hypothetical protein HMPREF0373_00707 [Eubacterium ramulus ATCC 29099]|uniref:Uncharacterized protein n=1 Tax=Eubacterium ramulus ATCC 29099 TaxID=1256908 RepID=U2PIU8_EUBRA|nr:hypothetical protein HMPREF0373_00707 [Eubacterium ramulus ATCC 29099]
MPQKISFIPELLSKNRIISVCIFCQKQTAMLSNRKHNCLLKSSSRRTIFRFLTD